MCIKKPNVKCVLKCLLFSSDNDKLQMASQNRHKKWTTGKKGNEKRARVNQKDIKHIITLYTSRYKVCGYTLYI